MEQTRNIIRLPLESCIAVPKQELIDKLVASMDTEKRDPFRNLCKTMEALIYLHHQKESKELLTSYKPLNPGVNELGRGFISSEAESREQSFLQKFFQLMETCKYKPLRDEEWKIATSSSYQLKLHVKVDRTKLDRNLFVNFVGARGFDYAKHQFVIFRQGVGVHQSSGWFIWCKWHALVSSLKNFLVSFICFGGRTKLHEVPSVRSAVEAGETRFMSIERFHGDDIRISNLFQKAHLQEPMYEHVVVLYRHAGKYGIHIKHYVDVPLADLELVLPAKLTPRPSTADIVKFLISIVFGIVLYDVLKERKHWVGTVILVLCILYSFKLLASFILGAWRYRRTLKKKHIRDKRLDRYEGVLVGLSNQAVQQKVKMAVLVYYILLKLGEPVSKEKLCFECERQLETMFNKRCMFGLNDTLVDLQNLQLVHEDNLVHHLPLDVAITVADGLQAHIYSNVGDA